jgi:hypothetical protein
MPAAMARVRQSVWRITSKVLHNSNVSYCVVARPISANFKISTDAVGAFLSAKATFEQP